MKAYDEKKVISSPSPPVLYIELTKNCIARCSFCRGKNWVNKPIFNMSEENFNILLNDYIPFATLVDLRGEGESLILPNFDEYVSKVARFKPSIRLTTTLGCGNQKSLQSLIDHDVFISVSFDAAEKSLYESIRPGISFDIVVKNIDFLTKSIIKKHGTLENRFRLGIVPLQVKNINQIDGIIRFAEKFYIPEIKISPLGSAPGDHNLLKYKKKETAANLRRAVALARKTGIRLRLGRSLFDEFQIKEKMFDLCCHPWLYIFITNGGEIGFCDHMIDPRLFCSIGDIFQKKEDVWNGEKIQRMRVAHLSKDSSILPGSCKRCYNCGRYADHEHELNPQFIRWLVTEDDIEKKLDQLDQLDT
ncbi:MAG: SPASM domain-containing protein [Candidatus Omnitrophica bacterium]|nr:SPASM domain-containing protein [Candidatus Omnitrophota bacterium]